MNLETSAMGTVPKMISFNCNAIQSININNQILRLYIDNVLPSICVDGDDEQHGSSALCDITCLQVRYRFF